MTVIELKKLLDGMPDSADVRMCVTVFDTDAIVANDGPDVTITVGAYDCEFHEPANAFLIQGMNDPEDED